MLELSIKLKADRQADSAFGCALETWGCRDSGPPPASVAALILGVAVLTLGVAVYRSYV